MVEEGPVLRTIVVAGDLASVLIRFAARQSFSQDAGGGGRDSNACLVACLLHHALRLVSHVSPGERDQLVAMVGHHLSGVGVGGGNSGGSGRVSAGATRRAEGGSAADAAAGGAAAGSWPMAFALSLLTHDLPTWQSQCTTWLQRVAGSGPSTTTPARRGTGNAPAATPGAFTGLGLAPTHVLRLVGLVSWLHTYYQAESSPADSAGATETTTQGATGSAPQGPTTSQGQGGPSRSSANVDSSGSGAGGSGSSGLVWVGRMRRRLEQLAHVPAMSAAFVREVETMDGLGDSTGAILAHVNKQLASGQ